MALLYIVLPPLTATLTMSSTFMIAECKPIDLKFRPGQANQLKIMSRLAPGFILKQMSRSVDRMLRTQN
jgi:hypothetical protein